MADDGAVHDCNCPPKGAPKWIVTFGDMMSLLLCFFVLMLSFSTTDIIKYQKMIGSLKDAFGISETTPAHMNPAGKQTILPNIQLPRTFAALVAVRAKAANLAKSSSELEMESGADWVRIKVPGDALFDSGDYKVKPEASGILEKIGDLINDFDGVVTIEGHTDGEPHKQPALPRAPIWATTSWDQCGPLPFWVSWSAGKVSINEN